MHHFSVFFEKTSTSSGLSALIGIIILDFHIQISKVIASLLPSLPSHRICEYCVAFLYAMQVHFFVSGIAAPCVCDIMWEMGSSLSLSWQTESLWKRCCRLSKRICCWWNCTHTRCMKYQAGVQLCKDTRDKKTYLSQEWILLFFLPFLPPVVDSLVCKDRKLCTRTVSFCLCNTRDPPIIKVRKQQQSFNTMHIPLFKCLPQYIRQVPWMYNLPLF